MKYLRHLAVCMLLLFSLCTLLCCCTFPIYEPVIKIWYPEDGVWYCEELKIQLSFDDNQDTFMEKDGIKIRCRWENHPNSPELLVLCQGSNTFGYKLGDVVFSGQFIELTNNKLVVEDSQTGEQYTFIRQDEPIG